MLAVTVIGNIGNDAEIKEFNGQKFIAFNVASTERYKDRQGNQHSRTTWVSCLKPGESSVVTYLKKGTQVYVRAVAFPLKHSIPGTEYKRALIASCVNFNY